jgi:APA family basic amino acid/polyamine antiporter
VLIVNTVFSRPREAAIGAALMLTGVPIYFIFKRNKKHITAN